MYIIETNQITKNYGKFVAVDHVDMHIKEGSIYGFVGENGSGKTTIMRLLTGLAELTSGSYTMFGVSNKSSDIYKVRNQTAAIVETASLVPTMTARDNILYAEAYIGVKLTEEQRNNLLALVHLENTGKKKVKNFSLGMRQRLAIALCLINEPKLLLLDEPMNGLDPEGIADLRETLVKLNQEKGITILISSHILSELEKIATDYGFILHGKMLEEISSQELVDKCHKSITLKVDNKDEAIKVLESLKLKNFKEYPNNEFRIYDEITINEIVKALDKAKVAITSLNSNDNNVEDYYLNLIKGGY
ncbi:MAG: ATP-binding cassette domain-containing protein [Bacilli bacterium]|nr:ATP-binding cassette domain-containing protein [Bacilli bacterium]